MVVHGKLCPVLKKTLVNIAGGEKQERTFGHGNYASVSRGDEISDK